MTIPPELQDSAALIEVRTKASAEIDDRAMPCHDCSAEVKR